MWGSVLPTGLEILDRPVENEDDIGRIGSYGIKDEVVGYRVRLVGEGRPHRFATGVRAWRRRGLMVRTRAQ
ncbi:hypothetical protein SAMN05216553_11972 [Lentzea fradiae]|uniref:Uncharacterized protein n=1 Tax=Lentzea fradiae TaxID=200378 RepID=A0A1G8BHL8_9PSEU|nr:hypothetical protein SAMN05216553_11972 [Lentzea fradiae]